MPCVVVGLQGLGLDFYEGEPAPLQALLGFGQFVLTPHLAGWSPQPIDASVPRLIEIASENFAGQPLVWPVVSPKG